MIYLAFLSYLLGSQIHLADLKLITRKINYKQEKAQYISYVAITLFLSVLVLDIYRAWSLWWFAFYLLMALPAAVLCEYVWSKINTKSLLLTIIYKIGWVSLFYLLQKQDYMSTFVLMGIYSANCPFGIVHGKEFQLSAYLKRTRPLCHASSSDIPDYSMLPDFRRVGNATPINETLPLCNVTDYGIMPGTGRDYTEQLNNLIEDVGKKGGGRIFFPKGQYLFNKNSKKTNFIRINYSNIVLEGEVDANGYLLSELICCNKTVYEKKNPWLSPFLITTAEDIQPSNWFWGLQFRKKKNIVTNSGSLSDPGSDGSILTPEFATRLTKDSLQGSDILHVADSSTLTKYVLLGLYNTDDEGSLIKDILGIEIKDEWKTPLRAGIEQAPSFQWLIEIAEVLDKHTIRLVKPLWRDCLMSYEPVLYNAPMLENICIRNLRISSKWNGLFRHHGFHLYYSAKQAKEMDYGWNAINFKRVAHGYIQNVEIHNFSNPLYLLDSRNVTVEKIEMTGYDGHQGIKLYEHACDNLLKDITFRCHFADMMGGEGNMYGNVFSNIQYLNPQFKPCDYDFHGFSEGPMSPPAYNLFEQIYGFRYIKMGGALYNQPACAQWNIWWNCTSEGEHHGDYILYSKRYVEKTDFGLKVGILLRSLSQKSIRKIYNNYKKKVKAHDCRCIPKEQVSCLFKNVWLFGYKSTFVEQNDEHIHTIMANKTCSPLSLYQN